MTGASAVFVSDTHNEHDDWHPAPAQYLFHVGDLTSRGTPEEVAEGLEWLSASPHEHVCYLPGNHDFAMMDSDFCDLFRRFVPRVKLLEPGFNVIGDLVVAAMPWMQLPGWAFCAPDAYIKARIADDLIAARQRPHLLVTHDPPHGVLDKVPYREDRNIDISVGSHNYSGLAKRLGAQAHAFGHIHECGGKMDDRDGVMHINAAVLCRDYRTRQHEGLRFDFKL